MHREIDGDRDGVRRRQWMIAGSLWWTGAVLLLGVPALFVWVVSPPRIDASHELAARLAFAAKCNAVAVLPYLLVCIRIMLGRFLEGAHNPLSHAQSAGLTVDCRVMQNHLEQTFVFAISTTALAAMLGAAQLGILAIATGIFVLGRLVFWWGYHREGTLGRAPGVQLTFGVTIPLALAAACLVLHHTFVG
jgi:uncharacterized membrane protein YecN with MAPEG domain